MSFSSDKTDYETTRQRLDAAKAEDITTHMQDILAYIRQNLEHAQESMVSQTNKHRYDICFKEGDMVFLDTRNIQTTRPSKKLGNKKEGPFKVIKVVGPAHKLQLPLIMKVHPVFSPKLLSLAPTDALPGQRNPPPEPIETPKGTEWTVEDILDSRRHYGKLQYQVRWKDDDDTLTWWNTDNKNPGPHNNVAKTKRPRRLRHLRDLATMLTLSARRR